jgi:5S rRNA maturation endonuclease (ribonuclease M5)
MRVKDISFYKAIQEAIKIIGPDFIRPSGPLSFIRPSSLDDGIDPIMLKGTASRQSVRNILNIPSLYFVDRRHFDPNILDEYDVGDCWKVGNKMRGRTVFPVYDENMLCVGAVGRKISDSWNTMKWKNSQDFKASETFYGIWNYTRTGRAIVVEGQGDLIKLRQAGYGDSLGMFKKCMSINQLKILQKFGVTDLLVVTDNDKAGNQGYESIMRNASNHFKITRYVPAGKDFGEMNVESLRKLCL